jgi:hypothetical protein
LNSHLSPQNFVWGEPINDADHWEYHPNWTGLAGGATLDKARKEAMEAAEAVDKAAAAAAAPAALAAATTTPATGTAPAATTATATPVAATTVTKTDWMQYFWYAAGAGGTAPPPKVEEPKTKADESKTKK